MYRHLADKEESEIEGVVPKLARRGLSRCPNCCSTSVRMAHACGLFEHLLTWLGRFPFRCHDCSARYLDWPIRLRDVSYAKCPRCFRMDLTTWDPKDYRTSMWQDLTLLLGGSHWRCEPCRCNFVSVRPRRGTYQRPNAHAETTLHAGLGRNGL